MTPPHPTRQAHPKAMATPRPGRPGDETGCRL